MHYVVRKFSIEFVRIFQRDRGGIRGEVCCVHYVVRKFPFVRIFQRDRGGISGKVWCMHYVVRKFSICKDFPERQGRDTWRGMLHALCCKEILHL